MAFKRFDFTRLWTSDDAVKGFPAYEPSETKVREDMQYQPDEIKRFINDRFMAELESTGGEDDSAGADHIGDRQQGTVGATLDAFAERFESNERAIRDLAAGESPEAVQASEVAFTESGWTYREITDTWELRILQSQHKRRNAAFGYKLQSRVEGVMLANTWFVACTNVAYDSESGDVVLTAEEPYGGSIVFFGV